MVCCSPWGHKGLDTTELANNINSSPTGGRATVTPSRQEAFAKIPEWSGEEEVPLGQVRTVRGADLL